MLLIPLYFIYRTQDRVYVGRRIKVICFIVDRCLYLYRNGDDWIKVINYVDDALYYASSKRVREHFEISLKNKFNLTLLGIAK